MVPRMALAAMMALLLARAATAAEDVLLADFEAADYGPWKTTGEAFGPGPAAGTLPRQMPVSGYLGKRLVSSFFKGDGATGTLTSPPFQVQRKFINFLIGGGMHPGRTCVNLLLDGKVVRTATGPNDRPGGSEALDWHGWDVGELIGKTVRIEIVDKQTGGWGHINVDHIIQSDTRRESVPAVREILIEKPYLHLPVRNGAPRQRMRFAVEGRTVREFDIELADGEPDFWVFADTAPFQGKRLRVEGARLPEGSKGPEAIVQSDDVPSPDTLYREKHRPQFHFSSRRGWNNDCNGLVWHKGEWHLYYQHNPYGWKWGNMHWGHAVSGDLVHWKELPVAIYPFRFGDWVFSGSAVVDAGNTAGFKSGQEDVIVAAYTSTGRGEAIAYSNDRGRTFTDYQGNPVVKHGGRDPKVIWYAPPASRITNASQGRRAGHWVMAVFDERDKSRGIAFYTSPDLKAWTFASRIDGYYECPEIFPMSVDSQAGKVKWILYAADGNYATGEFDGRTFAPDGVKTRFSYGNCFYASQTWNDVPASDGRRVQIAWARIATPGMPFNQMMTFPCELKLRTTAQGLRLFALPVREIETIRVRTHAWRDLALKPEDNPLKDLAGELLDIEAVLEPGQASECGLVVRGTPVAYDAKARQLSCKGSRAPLAPVDGRIRLRVLVDRTSIEVFANDGLIYMPLGAIHPEADRSLAAYAKGGEAKIVALEVHELRSAWRVEGR